MFFLWSGIHFRSNIKEIWVNRRWRQKTDLVWRMPVNNDNYMCPQTHSLSVPRDFSATVLPSLYILAPTIATKPDKWVHQTKYWDLVSRMGMWHQHKDDAFRCWCALVCMRAHASMCHLSMCECVIPLVYGLWQCWWVSLSSLIAAPADGLWIWQEGREKSVENLTSGSATGGRHVVHTNLPTCLDTNHSIVRPTQCLLLNCLNSFQVCCCIKLSITENDMRRVITIAMSLQRYVFWCNYFIHHWWTAPPTYAWLSKVLPTAVLVSSGRVF